MLPILRKSTELRTLSPMYLLRPTGSTVSIALKHLEECLESMERETVLPLREAEEWVCLYKDRRLRDPLNMAEQMETARLFTQENGRDLTIKGLLRMD